MKLSEMQQEPLFKGIIQGTPGSGKTGALVPLAEAGYKLRIINLDKSAGVAPFVNFCTPEAKERIDIVTLEQKYRTSGPKILPVGVPEVFPKTLKLMDKWEYLGPDGEMVDLGAVKDWGSDTVFVIDNLTSLSDAGMWRTCALQNRLEKGPRQRDWGIAQKDIDAACEILASAMVNCHVVVIAHLDLYGPPQADDNDDEVVKEAKAMLQNVVDYRYVPATIGRKLGPKIARHFPFQLLCESKAIGAGAKRVICTTPRPDMDIKCPIPGLPKELPIENGLATIFAKLKGE